MLRYGFDWTLPFVLVFIVGATTLASCDATYFRLPKPIQHPKTVACGALMAFAAGATASWHRLGFALLLGAACFTLFLILNLVNPTGMAFGDVRLAGNVGLVVG